MDKSPGEQELEARLAELRAERKEIDAQIKDALAGLRVLRGRPSGGHQSLTEQLMSLLEDGPKSRRDLAERLDEHDVDKVSRLLSYLANDKKMIQRSTGNLWEIRPS